jgi:hypothetical protein
VPWASNICVLCTSLHLPAQSLPWIDCVLTLHCRFHGGTYLLLCRSGHIHCHKQALMALASAAHVLWLWIHPKRRAGDASTPTYCTHHIHTRVIGPADAVELVPDVPTAAVSPVPAAPKKDAAAPSPAPKAPAAAGEPAAAPSPPTARLRGQLPAEHSQSKPEGKAHFRWPGV